MLRPIQSEQNRETFCRSTEAFFSKHFNPRFLLSLQKVWENILQEKFHDSTSDTIVINLAIMVRYYGN